MEFVVGSGGSTTIIGLDAKRKKAFKYFFEIYSGKNYIHNQIKKEIVVWRRLSKFRHIVKLIKVEKKKKGAERFFRRCPHDFFEVLTTQSLTLTPPCSYILQHPQITLGQSYTIAQMEYCPETLAHALFRVNQENWAVATVFLDQLIFQIFITLYEIRHTYPRFMHNDLFIRNVMIQRCRQHDIQYAGYFHMRTDWMVKICDFGMTELDASLFDPNRDFFTILYDIYDGENLGAQSLSSLRREKNWSLKIFPDTELDTYFSNYMNTAFLKSIRKKWLLDMTWNITSDPRFLSHVGLNTSLSRFETIFQPAENRK